MVVIWGVNFIFAKIAVRSTPAFLVVCLRTVLSGLFMIPVYRLGRRAPDPTVRPFTARDLPNMAAIGILGIVGNQMLFVMALAHTSVAHGAIVGATAPVMVLVGAALLGHERLGRRRVVGMVASAAGVAVLQFGRSPAGLSSPLGDLLMLGNAALFAGFSLFGKALSIEVGSLAVNAVAFWGGAILALPYAIWGLLQLGPANVSPMAWVSILYMAVFPSLVGYLITPTPCATCPRRGWRA